MKLGFDIDGVLADFNTAFINRVVKVTGRDLFPVRPFDIPLWSYPKYYGYTANEVNATWDSIKADTTFWLNLAPYPTTLKFAHMLQSLTSHDGHDIYFITSRLGDRCKAQTERWLEIHGLALRPTVLISSDKAACCWALKLTAYLDDNFDNAVAVGQQIARSGSGTVSFLLDRPWNQQPAGTSANGEYLRVDSPTKMLTAIVNLLD